MLQKVHVLGVAIVVVGLQSQAQETCEPIDFKWAHSSQSTEPVLIRCSDSSHDYLLSISIDSQDWELSDGTLGGMGLDERYRSFFELSSNRGTLSEFVDQMRQELGLSDVDMFIMLVDMVRELPYVQTFGGEQSPETTLALGQGDCSDKSLLLATLLGEMGIESRLLLDDVNEHAFLAFPIDTNGKYYALETTSPSLPMFEEKNLQEGQNMVYLDLGDKASETQFDILNEAIRWEAEKRSMYGKDYIYGNCQIRQVIEHLFQLRAHDDAVMSELEAIEHEINLLNRQLDPWLEQRASKVETINSIRDEINQNIERLNGLMEVGEE